MRKNLIIYILFIGLIVRLFFFFVLTPWDNEVFRQEINHFGDAAEYDLLANNIWKTGSLSVMSDTRTPGYPLLVAFFYYIFGQKGVWLILIFQILLDLATIYLIYLISRRMSSSLWIGPIAAFLYAINFQSALYANKLLTEIPFTFLIVLAVWLIMRGIQEHKKIFWFLGASGALFGIATLIRPVSLYLPVVIAVFWLISAFFIKKPFMRAVGELIIFLFVFILVISPWLVHNKKMYGYYELTTIQGKNLCCCNATYLKSSVEGISFSEAEKYFPYVPGSDENPFLVAHNCQRKAINYIASNIVHYIPLHFKGVLITFLGVGQNDISYLLNKEIANKDFMEGSWFNRFITEVRSFKDQYFIVPVLLLWQIIECLLFLIGMIILLIKKNSWNEKICAILIILFIAYLVNVVGIIGHTRFRIPVTPLYLVFTAYGLVFFIDKFRHKI